MPKAGRYDYPAKDLDECIEKVRRMHEVCGRQAGRDTVAKEAWGMSPRGGATLTLFATLGMYGLVETRAGQLNITDLGYKLAFAKDAGINEEELLRLKAEAVNKLELFPDLCRFVGEAPEAKDEQLRAFLREKAHVDFNDIPSIAPEIGRLYKSNAKYLVYLEKPVTPAPSLTPAQAGMAVGGKETLRPPGEARTEPLRIQYGNVYVQVPPDDVEAIALAKSALEFMEKMIREKKAESSGSSG